VLPRQVSRDCLVSYASNLYSVPAAYARQRVLLRVTEGEGDEVVIPGIPGEEAARHRVARGQHQRIIQPAHDQGLAPAAPVAAATFRQRAGATPTLDLATLLGCSRRPSSRPARSLARRLRPARRPAAGGGMGGGGRGADMSEVIDARVSTALARLKLVRVADCLDSIAAEAATDKVT
jgi:hypothetical protein